MPDQIPSDSQRARNIALGIGAVLVGLALVAAGVWLFLPRRVPDTAGERVMEPAQETSGSVSSSGSANTSDTDGASETTATKKPRAESPKRAPLVAFRLGTTLYVAEQDGSNPISVVRSESGAFALSPDGTVLAVATGSQGLLLHEVGGGWSRRVGSGSVECAPSWTADSKRCVYVVRTAAGSTVRSVRADGGSDRRLLRSGSWAVVSADGRRVACRRSGDAAPDSPITVLDLETGGLVAIPGSSAAQSWAWAPDKTLLFTVAGTGGYWELRSATADGASSRVVASAPLEAPGYALTTLIVSPDGAHAVCSAVGDDEYSRLWVADLVGGTMQLLTTRRDAYPTGWTADSSRLWFIEGNEYQGESTALMNIEPDGLGRRAVVTGARR